MRDKKVLNDSEFAVRSLFGRISILDRTGLRHMLKNANVISTFLVSTPSTGGKFTHPLIAPEFSAEVFEILISKRKKINSIAFIYLLILPTILAALKMPMASTALALSLMSIFVVGKYEVKHLYSKRELLEEKVRFYNEALHGEGSTSLIIVVFPLLVGALQFFLWCSFRNHNAVLEKFGLIYIRVFGGEYYRLFTAPFFHSGVMHGFGNCITFILFAKLSCRISGWWTILVAIIIAITSNAIFVGLMLFSNPAEDGLIGFSGGIAGLGGLILGASIARHSKLPKALHISLMPGISMSFFAFAIFSNASILLHLIGFVLGVATGFVITLRHGKSRFKPLHNRA